MYDFKIYSYSECPAALFQFRYDVYVKELGRKQRYADDSSQTIKDPLDPTAFHGVATARGNIAAVIRLNYIQDGHVDFYQHFYEIDKLPLEEQKKVAICTRNMTAKRYRHTPLGFRMIMLAFEYSANRDATICYIDVNDPLLPLFKKLGFRKVKKKMHPDYGLVNIMRLDGLDIEYLKRVKSPFAPLSARYIERNQTNSDRVRAPILDPV